MTSQEQIENFLSGKHFEVVGTSQDRSKYGNKVLRVYRQNSREVVPVNPKADEVEGVQSYPDLSSIPGDIDGVSIITPPAVTERVVHEAVANGIKHIWMQPGAESKAAVRAAEESGANVIAGGAVYPYFTAISRRIAVLTFVCTVTLTCGRGSLG